MLDFISVGSDGSGFMKFCGGVCITAVLLDFCCLLWSLFQHIFPLAFIRAKDLFPYFRAWYLPARALIKLVFLSHWILNFAYSHLYINYESETTVCP